MKSILLNTAFLVMTTAVMAGDPVPAEALKAAVQKLADSPNYSWVITVSSGEKSRFTPGPVEGRTEKGGFTHWKMTFGERNAEAYVKDGQVVVNSGDGWTCPEKLKPPSPPCPGPPPPSVTSRDGKKDGRHKGHKDGFLAHRLRSMKLPAETAAGLALQLPAVQRSGDEFTGDLTAEAAKELLGSGSNRREGSHAPPEPVNPRGTVKFQLKDGMLQKLEIHLASTMNLNGTELVIDRTTEIIIKDAGTTKLDVPAEAKKLLESEPSPPSPQKQPA